MPSPESQRIRATLVHDQAAPVLSLPEQRAAWEAACADQLLPASISVTPVVAGGVQGEWVASRTATSRSPVIIWLHGGGHTTGSPITHRSFAAQLALATNGQVLVPDFRLAPEHPFPAPLEDTAAVYRWLLASGLQARQIVIGGDSSGGGVALGSLLYLRANGLALPGAAVLISPWLDMTLSGSSLTSEAANDPLVAYESLAAGARYYLGDHDPHDALASPIFGDLHNLPPILIQVGAHEVLLSDSTRLAEGIQAAGGKVQLEVWPDMWHVWHAWAPNLPEGVEAFEQIAAFMQG